VAAGVLLGEQLLYQRLLRDGRTRFLDLDIIDRSTKDIDQRPILH
jgi:hypothetical protein